MTALVRIGRIFFSAAIMAYGTQQIIIGDFRPQIVPGFPAWAHTIPALPLLTGELMIIAAMIVSGPQLARKTAIALALYFLLLIVACHIPYLLFVYPHKLSHLGSWGDVLKTLAFSGAAMIVADTYAGARTTMRNEADAWPLHLRLTEIGKVFYCTTIILFGCNHFAYDLSPMVPKWFGMPVFWSYVAGTALVLSGLAILLNFYLRIASLLLATMLFLWVIFLHIPNAVDHPYAGRGNPIVSAFDALMFCGVALILSQAAGNERRPEMQQQ